MKAILDWLDYMWLVKPHMIIMTLQMIFIGIPLSILFAKWVEKNIPNSK